MGAQAAGELIGHPGICGFKINQKTGALDRVPGSPIVFTAFSNTNFIVVDRNPDALKLAEELGAHHTVVADGGQVDAVQKLTNGGADVVLDFVAEEGAENEGFAMTRRNGSYFVIGYGGKLEVPTLDIISTERNIIGNIVGTYNDLAELMVLAQNGKVTLHTNTFPLDAAVEALQRATGINARVGSYHYVLATIYRRLGKVEESRAAMETFTRLDRESNEIGVIDTRSQLEVKRIQLKVPRLVTGKPETDRSSDSTARAG